MLKKKRLKEGLDQIKNGDVLTEKEADQEIDKWLGSIE